MIEKTLKTLNSATKYPSIPTYHALGAKGMLTDQAIRFDGTVYVTEKIDGTNGRIVFTPDLGDYVIGIREELVYARGDRIANPFPPAREVIEVLKPLAERIVATRPDSLVALDRHHVLYLEVYGGGIGLACKEYTGTGAIGFRLFDWCAVDARMLEWSPVQLAAWRDGGGQPFADFGALQRLAEDCDIPLVPHLAELNAAEVPVDVAGMQAFLAAHLEHSLAVLDGGGRGRPEGIVLRDFGRSTIAKARLFNYRRTLGAEQSKSPGGEK